MTAPIWLTPPGFLFTATELVNVDTVLTADGDPSAFQVISGSLPAGMMLDSEGRLYGTPYAVTSANRNKFVVRASNADGVSDRTFYIDVTGSDSPVWSTDEGFLNVGIYGENYALNNQWIDYDLSASAFEALPGTVVKFYIGELDGKLPPGLTLSQSGKITGFIRDRLTFEGGVAELSGYDSEPYDVYGYDRAIATNFLDFNFDNPENSDPSVFGLPKTYKFRITATDGVESSVRTFKIVVTSVEILQYNPSVMPAGTVINTGTNYVHPAQWVQPAQLDIVRASNNVTLDVSAYDATPLVGPVTYQLISGTSIYENIPQGLSLDSETGYIFGFLPYQPAYTLNYSVTVSATKYNQNNKNYTTSTNTFEITVKGEVESSIEWVSTSSLGNLVVGEVSESAVVATHLLSDYTIKYQLQSGSLPDGITLLQDGTLAGRPSYSSAGTYTFTVVARDVYELSAIEQTFTLTVVDRDTSVRFTEIYIRPFFSMEKRNIYREFISNEFIFDQSLLYRPFDSNFGVQPEIKMMLEFGIEQYSLGTFTVALRENFYRRRFYFGDIKTAIAKDSDGNTIYEIVYIDPVDDMVNNQGVSVSPVVYTNNEIYYPSSVDNMRRQLQLLILDDKTYIEVNYNNLPRFMTTYQQNSNIAPGYVRVVPLCYALPGQSAKIVSRIKLSNFNFKQFDFEIDRIIVQESLDNPTPKYLIFDRQALGDLVYVDTLLYGPDDVRLDDESSDSINRE